MTGKGNTDKSMQTSLRGIVNKAANDKQHRFGSLYRLLNEANLRESFYKLRKSAATVIDGFTFQSYEGNHDENLANLVERQKAKRYRAKLVKRKLIPKSGSDKKRPLGIPALEDKFPQRAVADILSVIYEQCLRECSYRYRKGNCVLERRLSREWVQSAVKNFTKWMKDSLHQNRQLLISLKRKLVGYWNYYAIKSNLKSCSTIYYHVTKNVLKWINRGGR